MFKLNFFSERDPTFFFFATVFYVEHRRTLIKYIAKHVEREKFTDADIFVLVIDILKLLALH